MGISKWVFSSIFLFSGSQSLETMSLAERFQQVGYAEFRDTCHGNETFDALYAYFDELILFLQKNPVLAKKLYLAKQYFIRSEDNRYYSTDFFGFYDDSERVNGRQVSFYYSFHFHNFLFSKYPEFHDVSEITRFFNACLAIQRPYESLFDGAAAELGCGTIFSSEYGRPPVLLKVVKYLPSYIGEKPHYDGTVFSLFLDSTDYSSLRLSPYKPSYTPNDFSSPLREFSRERNENSIILIPGAFLTDFLLYPTPHIVLQTGKVRYATIAFAMRPAFDNRGLKFSSLPVLKNIE